MVNPKRIILFGQYKQGKSRAISELEDTLILDFEGGYDFFSAQVININSLKDFSDTVKALKEAKANNGGKNPYKRICIDNTTVLEEMAVILATKEYKSSTMGQSFKGDDVRTLAQGSGYHWLRIAFFKMIDAIQEYCDTLILVAHVKDKDITKGSETVNEKSISLTGKSKDICAASACAVGLVYREDNKTYINFQPSESLLVGARPEHLRGKKFIVAESDENGNISVNWDEIFLKD